MNSSTNQNSSSAATIAMTALIGLSLCPVQPVAGQVVQLPSIQTFSYSGSVSVPDRGSVSLGGVSRSGSFSSRSGLGPLSRRSAGGFQSQSSLIASATIIDLEAMDRRLLDEDNAAVGKPQVPIQSSTRFRKARGLIQYARKRNAAGDHGLAKVAYEMAIEHLHGDLRRYAVDEYRRRYPVSR